MTSPKDIIPQKYEVLKLRSGSEVVGMTRDTATGVEITLPMICRLEVVNPEGSHTLATFYPYAPLSSDPMVTLPNDMIAHRSSLNEQFVPFYDEASARWFDMVENKTIPLTGDRKEIRRAYLDRIVQDLMNATGGPISEREERMLQRMEEEEWDEFDEQMADFEHALPPSDKKKIH
mgnify:FL=1|tara:strand:- start:175 stop:702 length:528 start_codon:yes stop_codon:yes gene_type:complete